MRAPPPNHLASRKYPGLSEQFAMWTFAKSWVVFRDLTVILLFLHRVSSEFGLGSSQKSTFETGVNPGILGISLSCAIPAAWIYKSFTKRNPIALLSRKSTGPGRSPPSPRGVVLALALVDSGKGRIGCQGVLPHRKSPPHSGYRAPIDGGSRSDQIDRAACLVNIGAEPIFASTEPPRNTGTLRRREPFGWTAANGLTSPLAGQPQMGSRRYARSPHRSPLWSASGATRLRQRTD
jgi:hypothetical protein